MGVTETFHCSFGPLGTKKAPILDEYRVDAYQNDHQDELNQDFIKIL